VSGGVQNLGPTTAIANRCSALFPATAGPYLSQSSAVNTFRLWSNNVKMTPAMVVS